MKLGYHMTEGNNSWAKRRNWGADLPGRKKLVLFNNVSSLVGLKQTAYILPNRIASHRMKKGSRFHPHPPTFRNSQINSYFSQQIHIQLGVKYFNHLVKVLVSFGGVFFPLAFRSPFIR